MKKIFILIIIIIAIVWWYNSRTEEVVNIEMPMALDYQEFISTPIAEVIEPEEVKPEVGSQTLGSEGEINLNESEESITKPVSINLNIPFTSQAPTANWEQPWQDACEEASFLMVDYYYQNKELPSAQEVEQILSQMVDWQVDNWGGHYDLPVAEVVKYIQATSDYQAEVILDLTADKIKNWLDQGVPVIVPADGTKLNNPNFSGEGPDYHMLVIKGYVDNKFITNDPGTKRGKDFVYTTENLFYSIADWVEDEEAAVGPLVGLVVYPVP